MTKEKTELVLMRLDRLYRDLPIEYAGYALTAIQDIEVILYAADIHSDKGYSIGTEEERLSFEKNRLRCWCYNCNKDRLTETGIPYTMTRMILCPTCGNKRCPHATDHNLPCTNSNEPGQKGSRY